MEQFSYKLKSEPIKLDSDNFIADYLQTLGIHKIESFLNQPDKYDEEPYKNLENINEIIDAIHSGLINNKKFFIQIDSDVDGYTSAAIFYKYFKDLYPNVNIEYRVHEGKEHGVIFDSVNNDIDIVIIPDAGSNQFEIQEQLSKAGKQVLIMDHHLVDNFITIDNVIVVNNQLSSKFKNKFLSGAGVVYKVIQAYSNKYHDGKYHINFMDLTALGIISDMMDTRILDNNYLIYHGLRNIQNPLFKALLQKQSYSISNTEVPNKIDIAFYITPLINAVIRVGSIEQNRLLFEGLIDYHNTDTYERTYRGMISTETFYEMLARVAYNIRNQQNKAKEKARDFLDLQINKFGLQENTVIAVITSNDDDVEVPKTMTGLVAMDIVKHYKKPALVLRPRSINGESFLYGSGRANIRPGFPSFKSILNDSNLVAFAEGHDMAFGVGIEEEKLPLLINYLNKKLSHIDFGKGEIIEVDAILRGKEIQPIIFTDFAEYNYLYGMGIPQPKFAFEFVMSRDRIELLGKQQTTLKFVYNNIEFIKFHATDIIQDLFKSNEKEVNNPDDIGFLEIDPKLRFKIIGRAQYNEFAGRKTLQIIIDYMEHSIINISDLL
jgi:single-stranded-DNA-specific exonuclease